MKVFCTTFMCLQFGFVVFWQKEMSAKAARKILVKLNVGDAFYLESESEEVHHVIGCRRVFNVTAVHVHRVHKL